MITAKKTLYIDHLIQYYQDNDNALKKLLPNLKQIVADNGQKNYVCLKTDDLEFKNNIAENRFLLNEGQKEEKTIPEIIYLNNDVYPKYLIDIMDINIDNIETLKNFIFGCLNNVRVKYYDSFMRRDVLGLHYLDMDDFQKHVMLYNFLISYEQTCLSNNVKEPLSQYFYDFFKDESTDYFITFLSDHNIREYTNNTNGKQKLIKNYENFLKLY